MIFLYIFFRIYNKITILSTQDSNIALLFKHVYVYAINISYENTIPFILVNIVSLILTLSNNMGNIPMHTFLGSIFQIYHNL